MSESVCYVTIDKVDMGEKSHRYDNLNTECIINNSKRFSGDGPSSKKSGIIVAHNHYDNLLYKTKIETLDPNSSTYSARYSQCDGPDSIRGVTSYYETSKEVLKACDLSSPICYVPIDFMYSEKKTNLYKNINTECLIRNSQLVNSSYDGSYSFSFQSGVVVAIDPDNEVYKTQIKIPTDTGYCYDHPSLFEFSFFNTSEEVLKLCENNIWHIAKTQITSNIIAAGSLAVVAGTIGASMYYYTAEELNIAPPVVAMAEYIQRIVMVEAIINNGQDGVFDAIYEQLPFAEAVLLPLQG